MKYAIIAAGEGSRLSGEGIKTPKPLIEICGETMIERLIRIFSENGASEIVIIINEQAELVGTLLKSISEKRSKESKCPLTIVRKTTPSSMHSLNEIAPLLESEPFCLTTVDTIFKESEFHELISTFRAYNCDGMMGVTSFIDDESPLYISCDENLKITAFNDKQQSGDIFISGGIYCLKPRALTTLKRCIEQKKSRMRNFQRALIEDGLNIRACRFSKIIDVDHASDIEKAEQMITSK